MSRSPNPTAYDSSRRACGFMLALFFLLFGIYGLTGSKLRFGYEGGNIDQAEALVRGLTTARPEGGIFPFTQGGLLDVAAYLPFTAAKLLLEKHGLLLGIRQLIYIFAIPFYTALILLIFYELVLTLYRKPETAAALTMIVGLGTMIWPYAKFGMETQQTLWTLAAILMLLRYSERPTFRYAIVFGVTLSALMLTKVSGPVHAVMLGLAALWIFIRKGLWRRPGALGHAGALVGGCLVGSAFFLFTNRWRYGGWLWQGRYGLGHEMSPYPFLEGLWAVLFSHGKSIFLFSPPLLLGLWFWGKFWRRFPLVRPILVVMLLVAIYHLHLRPWADETWGPRRLHYLVPILALPLGVWLEERMNLRRWVRTLGLAVLALGVWVQLVAIAFDYTALAKIMGNTELFAQENTVWEPQLAPIGFNLHLAASAWQRHQTGQSLPFVYEYHYMPWSAPERRPAPLVYPMKGLDRLDFWPLQQRADWPDRPYWFVSGTSYLAVFLGLMALASGVWLLCRGLCLRNKSAAP